MRRSASRALSLECAVLASGGPVAAQHSAMLLNGEAIRQPFTSRTAVDVLGRNIDEVLLAKTTCGFCARGQRFRQCHRDASFLTGKNFLAIVVAAISNNVECVDTHLGTGLRPCWRVGGDRCP